MVDLKGRGVQNVCNCCVLCSKVAWCFTVMAAVQHLTVLGIVIFTEIGAQEGKKITTNKDRNGLDRAQHACNCT